MMFCRKCGAQIPDDSSFCPKCGAPITTEYSADSDVQEIKETITDSKMSRPSKGKPIAFILIAAVVVIVAVFAFMHARQSQGLDISADTVKITQLYNPALGVGVKLGMDKADLDRILGTPRSVNEDYQYEDTKLYVGYSGGKLSHLYVTYPNDRWITCGGITIETTTNDLLAILGEPTSIEHDDKWWYYITGNVVTGFEINRDFVMSIYIYDSDLVQE